MGFIVSSFSKDGAEENGKRKEINFLNNLPRPRKKRRQARSRGSYVDADKLKLKIGTAGVDLTVSHLITELTSDANDEFELLLN